MKPALKAFFASFAIYLLPLIGPHAFILLGAYLFTHRGPTREMAWLALEWVVAGGLQLVAGALWYWFFKRPQWWRLIPLAACVPVFGWIVLWSYLVVIPARFLIEPDTAPESGSWTNVCNIADMSVAQVRTVPDLALETAGQAWLTGTGMNDYAVLEMPGCQTQPVNLPATAPMMTLPYVLPGGRCLFSTWDNQAGRSHWWVHGVPPRAVPGPDRFAPVMSPDGNWVAWLEYIPGVTVTPLPLRVALRAVHEDRTRFVKLPEDRSEFVLLGVNMATEELTFYEHAYATRQSSLTVLGFDGVRRGPPLVVTGVEPQATTVRRIGQGWVAWDAYRENARHRVAWELPGGRGTHAVLKGRGITAVAVNPSGTFIAISTTTALNIGHIRDSVYVLRTSDGKELWRRYLPPYTRSMVAFLGTNYFAYTDWDGPRAVVRVLQ